MRTDTAVADRWLHVRTPQETVRRPGRWSTIAGSVILLLLAGVGLARGGSRPLVLLALLLAVTVPAVDGATGGLIGRMLATVGRWAAHAVSAAAFTALGVVVVAIPWALRRRIRRSPGRVPTSWRRREMNERAPERPWAGDPVVGPVGPGPRVRPILVAGLAVALLSLPWTWPTARTFLRGEREATGFELTAGGSLPEGFGPEDLRDPVPPGVRSNRSDAAAWEAALADDEWFTDEDAYNTAQGWALDPAAAWRPINPYRLLDFRSKYLNVVDGERRSWSPPPCTCRRITVWMYGGSTTYGLNQRDEHTIASELARVGFRHGFSLEVHNRGANGHLHWMEAERFAWDLTFQDPPDLVLFYDGVNEIWEASALSEERSGDDRAMIDPTTRDLWRRAGGTGEPEVSRPPGARLERHPPVEMEIGELVDTILRRYERARTLSRTTARAHGVPVRYLWQPSRFSRPLVPDEPHYGTDEENRGRLIHDLLRDRLPNDVIDVADALRSTQRPLFTDDVHHNEYASRLIAAAIFSAIRPDLDRIRTSSEGGSG